MKKLYVLQRKDLPTSYQAVQAGHAVAEFLLNGPDTEWDNGILIYLGVNNEKDLIRWSEKLKMKRINYVVFKEPDIGNQITSLATVCEDKIFRNLKLL